MKKFTTLCLAAAVVGTAFAQKPQAPRSYVASPAQMTSQATYAAKLEQLKRSMVQESMVRAYPVSSAVPTYSPNGKVAAVSPIGLGQSSNIFTVLTTDQNQVYANDALDLVTFIHRNDASVWGGSSGHLRYDVSIDGGGSFNNDIGNINPLLSRVARYPNITSVVEAGVTNPLDAKVAYLAPTLNPTPDFDGHVAGVCQTVTSGTPTGTENYLHLSAAAYLPASLCEGQAGEFWAVDREYAGAAFTGNFFVNKGVWNSGTSDIDWARVDTVAPSNSTSFDGTATVISVNISFSPDGNTGWISWLGDLVGGPDSTLQPIFMKSTDGGDTWGAPVEFDMATIPWIADTLKSLWTDSLGNPVSSGRATCAFESDLIVDAMGNPHLAVVVGSGSTIDSPEPGYSIYSGIAKFFADVWTPDGGTTWDVAYISPVLAFRGLFGTGDGVNMDNNPQVARNTAGTTIFYSWADSDTSQFTGSMNGIGFGESDNIAPNLRTASRKPYTNEQTYPKRVTDGDLTWEGRALFPTMSPVVLSDGGTWKMPIVLSEMLSNDPLASTKFWYFGNDATFTSTDFCVATSMTLSWDVIGSGLPGPCAVGVDNGNELDNVVLGQSYPNPTANEAYIVFELPALTNVNMNLTNMYGQQVGTIVNGDLAAGSHKVTVDTRELAAGVYFYTLNANGKAYTKKMIVTK